MLIPKIAINSAIYTIFNVLQRALNFFLLPLYTLYLTPEDYGITNVLVSACALLTFLLTFSLQASSARFHYKYSKNPGLVKQIWGSNQIFVLCNSFFWVVFFCVLYKYTLKYLIGDNIPFYPYALIAILNCSFSPIYLYFQTYLQTTQQAKYYVINNLSFFLTQLSLTVYFVVGLHMKALGVIAAQLIVNIIFGIYAILSLRKYITYKFSSKILIRSLRYSVPLIPHNLSGWLNSMLDRIFINRIVNIANVGLYSVGYQIGSIVNLLGLSINQAYTPFFFQNHSTEEGKRHIGLITDIGILIVSLIALFVAYFSQEIVYYMTSTQYHSVWPVIVILVAANMFDCIYKFYVAVLFLDKTPQLSVISITCSLITCVLNVLLISLYGYLGAALTYTIVQLLVSLVVCIYARKLRPDIPYRAVLHYSEIIVSILIMGITVVMAKNLTIEYRLLVKICSYTLVAIMLVSINYRSLKILKK